MAGKGSLSIVVLLLAPLAVLADKVLYDFRGPCALIHWSNLELPGAKEKEPPVKIERSTEHAAPDKRTLKLTFAGGRWPTVGTTDVSEEWLEFKTFKAEVYAARSCVIGFTLLQEKSRRGEGWEDVISRWTTTTFLKPGKNEVVAPLPGANDYAVHRKWGSPVGFEIFLYNPHPGESIYIDNIRLSNDKVPPKPKTTFAIQGTGWTVSGVNSADACRELARNVAHLWSRPAATTLEEVEEDFQARYAAVKKRHPKAVLAILRDGETGYDPAHPDKVYAGWKDAYWSSHGPDTAFAERARNRGHDASHEVFMRHRSPLMRVDFSSIPTGSNILAAELVIVRTTEPKGEDNNPAKHPTMWVVEPCNRPWDEYEVNAFQYAHDKFWKEIGGWHWGDDPDFLPVFLAWGPGRPGKVSTWDFVHAVRFWTDGKHANHGFMLHGDSGDYMLAHSREAAELRNRPAVLVIYVPK
jgi:hypothetical protein